MAHFSVNSPLAAEANARSTFETRYNGDLTLSRIGYGGVPAGNYKAALSDEEAVRVVRSAYHAGVRYFDTSPFYGLGLSEERFGEALSAFDRHSFVISSKIGRVLHDCSPEAVPETIFVETPSRYFEFDYSYDGVMRSYEDSLRRLRMDRIDILFAHDVDVVTHGSREASDQRINELMSGGYKAMDELRRSGDVRAIGGAVDEWDVCETLAERGEFDCFLLAGRYTLLEQGALESFLPECEKNGTSIILGGPYNSGILATGAVPGARYEYEEAPQPIMERVRQIEQICSKHGIAIAEAALQFVLAHPAIVSVIPGASNIGELEANVRAESVQIPPAIWAELVSAELIRSDSPTPQ